ncbi:MAG TPA: signal peptidase I [Actinomycetota bacterium]|nr:signal peptidase I [Actinomycetota bacterium]
MPVNGPRGPEEDQPEEDEGRHRSFWKELPVLVVVAFGIALLIKTFALQAFYIPSASMEPTLKIGDRVLVEKLTYRFGSPSRGDVVVFEKDLAHVVSGESGPDEPFWIDIANAFRDLFGFPTGTSQDFIKRVIAVEGDVIEGRDGQVYVNNELVEETYLPDGMPTSNFGPQTIPEGMIFVMGDNRNNSDDSRNFGPIPVDHVVGQAFLLIWPPADFAAL